MSVNDTDTRHPSQFLTDLVQAMGEAARTERQATIDQCQSDAKAYTEHLRAGTNGGAAALHRAAVADVSTIREQSKAAAERIRIETAERISRRNRRLERELQEYDSVIETEIHRVGEQVEAFEAEVAQFFEQLVQGTDPVSFLTIATRLPNPPAFVDPDPRTLLRDLRRGHSQAAFTPRSHAKPRSGQPG
jgi:uncharacterized protein (DUF885 family)